MKITAIPMPPYDEAADNFAEVGMAAWLATYGGRDVTGRFPDDFDRAIWVGDWQAPNGEAYRLLFVEGFNDICACPLKVQYDLGEPITHGGEHIWTGAEWLAETRDEDAIRRDIHADLPDDADGEFVAVFGEPIFR